MDNVSVIIIIAFGLLYLFVVATVFAVMVGLVCSIFFSIVNFLKPKTLSLQLVRGFEESEKILSLCLLCIKSSTLVHVESELLEKDKQYKITIVVRKNDKGNEFLKMILNLKEDNE